MLCFGFDSGDALAGCGKVSARRARLQPCRKCFLPDAALSRAEKVRTKGTGLAEAAEVRLYPSHSEFARG
jgi:hypothetical protein